MSDDRMEFVDLRSSIEQDSFAEHVRSGLSQDPKQLSPRFLYDERGSELFERITQLPEYYPYDAERDILTSRAPDIVSQFDETGALVELGSGSAEKTRILIREASKTREQVRFVPVDISGEFLRSSSRALLETFGNLSITAIAGTYEDALEELPETDGSRLILFLGGNIGNYPPEEARTLLQQISSHMTDEDRLMVGFDLLKDPDVIERAYNDDAGVTAAFNKNILRRMNRELNANFELDAFSHSAPFVDEKQRVEMHLVSEREQEVAVRSIGERFQFEEGESIHTESSHKFNPDSFESLYEHTDLRREQIFFDADERFAEVILERR